jgi:uncharacterized protein
MEKKMKICAAGLLLASLLWSAQGYAADPALPWGSATEINQEYSGQKVVYDTTTGSLEGLVSVLDRASLISKLNGGNPLDTRIVIMIHGQSIPFFASKNFSKYKDLMIRANSLSIGDVIEFRMCRASAKLQGYTAKDIQGFVKMVPMADAEIVRLQQEEGFAYMR